METAVTKQPRIFRQFLKASFWTFTGATGLRGFTLVSAILFGRIAGNVDFGKFSTLQNAMLLIVAYSLLGLGVTTAKHIAELHVNSRQTAFDLLVVSIIVTVSLSLLIGFVVLIFADLIATRLLNSADLATPLRILSVFLFSFALNDVFEYALNGYSKYRLNALVNLAKGILTVVLLPFGAIVGGVNGAVAGYTLAEVVTSIFYLYEMRKLQQSEAALLAFQPRRALRQFLRMLLKFSIPLSFGTFLLAPVLFLTRALLANQPDGYAAVGLFSAAEKWYQLVLFVPATLAVFNLPFLSNLLHNEDTGSFHRGFFLSLSTNMGFVTIIGVGMILFSPLLVGLFGKEFAEATSVLTILIFAALGTVLNTTLGGYLVSRGYVRLRMMGDLLLAALLLILGYGLIPTYLERGLALSYALAYTGVSILLAIFVVYVARKEKQLASLTAA